MHSQLWGGGPVGQHAGVGGGLPDVEIPRAEEVSLGWGAWHADSPPFLPVGTSGRLLNGQSLPRMKCVSFAFQLLFYFQTGS